MIGVIEMGLSSLSQAGIETFGTGVIAAVFHCRGTMPAAIDSLNNSASGAGGVNLLTYLHPPMRY